MWAEHILPSCMELHLRRVLKSVQCSLRSCFAIVLGWRMTSKPWGSRWITLFSDRTCSGLFWDQIPQGERVCPAKRTLGHCLYQVFSLMCITLASTMYDQLKTCFALFIPYNTLTNGNTTFQAIKVLGFSWYTHRHTLSLKLKLKETPLNARMYEKVPSKKSREG